MSICQKHEERAIAIQILKHTTLDGEGANLHHPNQVNFEGKPCSSELK